MENYFNAFHDSMKAVSTDIDFRFHVKRLVLQIEKGRKVNLNSIFDPTKEKAWRKRFISVLLSLFDAEELTGLELHINHYKEESFVFKVTALPSFVHNRTRHTPKPLVL